MKDDSTAILARMQTSNRAGGTSSMWTPAVDAIEVIASTPNGKAAQGIMIDRLLFISEATC